MPSLVVIVLVMSMIPDTYSQEFVFIYKVCALNNYYLLIEKVSILVLHPSYPRWWRSKKLSLTPSLRPYHDMISLKTFFLLTLNSMHLEMKIQCYDVDIGWEDATITSRSQTDFYPPNPIYPNHSLVKYTHKKNAIGNPKFQ